MTFTTVNEPRRLANTSIRPRYGLSLNRTGALFSSVDANVSGALECSGDRPPAKAITSRFGAIAREVSLTRLSGLVRGALVLADEDVVARGLDAAPEVKL